MFTQVDRTLEKTTGGLGIGLSLVKGLVEMHGGTIEARSEGEGQGSEFVVRLPVARGPDAAGVSANESVPSGVRRILVVDDNADAADSLGQLLEMLGNEVRTAYDGEAGVAAAGEFRPDLIFLDLGMPKMNGYEACRRVRGQPWGEGVTLVALTGWGQDDDRRKTADAGFDHHLVKPVEYAALTKLMAGLDAKG
jgi:CheY-like chemotaxis protein